jgi:hypothetical protein
MYVLGSEGTLWGSYSDNLPLVRTNTGGLVPDHRRGNELPVEVIKNENKNFSFYHDNIDKINPCKCYEQ